MDKIIITKKGVKEAYFTVEELAQIEQEKLQAEEQAKIDILLPSEDGIKKAERQINLINDLTELGVI